MSLGQSGPGQGSDGDPDKGPQRGCMSLGQSGPGQGSDRDPDKSQTGTRTRVSRGPGQGSPTKVHVVCQTEGSGPCKSPNLSLSVIGLWGYSIQPSLSLRSNANVCYAKIWLYTFYQECIYVF